MTITTTIRDRARRTAGARSYESAKHVMDAAAAALLIALLAPLAAVIVGGLLIVQGRPVYFRQRRTGLRGETFTMIKFRTMLPDANGTGTASDHLRVTRLGRFLRATSLDELPNLFNVIRGEMSIIGPRPQLALLIEHHSERHHERRHDVRPGITGLAQVNGRNDLDFVDRFEFDLQYVRTCSFRTDAGILLRTIPTVLFRRGASSATACDLAVTDTETAVARLVPAASTTSTASTARSDDRVPA